MVCLPTSGAALVLAGADGLGLPLTGALELGCGEPGTLATPGLALKVAEAEAVPLPVPVSPVPLAAAADVDGATSLVTLGGCVVGELSSSDRVTLCGAVVGSLGAVLADAVASGPAVVCALLREAAAADAELT
jgi:hypothetical protein